MSFILAPTFCSRPNCCRFNQSKVGTFILFKTYHAALCGHPCNWHCFFTLLPKIQSSSRRSRCYFLSTIHNWVIPKLIFTNGSEKLHLLQKIPVQSFIILKQQLEESLPSTESRSIVQLIRKLIPGLKSLWAILTKYHELMDILPGVVSSIKVIVLLLQFVVWCERQLIDNLIHSQLMLLSSAE